MDARQAAGILSLGAAFAHGGLTGSHFAQWWGYGLFFLTTTVAQAVLGLALLMQAFEAAADQRRVALAGVIGNALVAAMYVVSRTSGVPWFGPAAGEVEPFDALGVLTLAAELATIALLVAALARRAPSPRAPAPPRPPASR